LPDSLKKRSCLDNIIYRKPEKYALKVIFRNTALELPDSYKDRLKLRREFARFRFFEGGFPVSYE